MPTDTIREVREALTQDAAIMVLPYEELTLAERVNANRRAAEVGAEQGAADQGNGGQVGDDNRYLVFVVEPEVLALGDAATAEVRGWWTREDEADDPRAQAWAKAFAAAYAEAAADAAAQLDDA